jgi:hypothetical protein
MVFSEFLSLAPATDSRRGEAEYYVAFSALSLGHRDGEKLIDDFIDHNPSSPKASTAYYDLANFFYAEANYVKAASYFKKVNFPALTLISKARGILSLAIVISPRKTGGSTGAIQFCKTTEYRLFSRF